MKVGLYGGVFLTTPVILYQLWGFVSPGLYENERKLASPFIVFGTLAFLAGAAFCYLAVLPQMFQFLLREETAIALELARQHRQAARRRRAAFSAARQHRPRRRARQRGRWMHAQQPQTEEMAA